MKQLVLGANGFIGKELVKYLIENQEEIIAFDKNIPIDEKLGDVSYIEGNFLEYDFTALLPEVGVIYHLISATLPFDGTDNSIKELTDNVIPTIKLLDAMVACGVKKILFVSSAGTVYGETAMEADEGYPTNPICSYGIGKLCIEKYLSLYQRYHGINAITVRLTNPYGSSQNPNKRQGVIPIFVRSIIEGKSINIWGTGDAIRDFIHISDAVCAIIAVAEYTGDIEVFNIASGERYSLNEIITFIEQITGKTANITYTKPRLCDSHANDVSAEKIKKECGWNAKISLQKGISTVIESIKK